MPTTKQRRKKPTAGRPHLPGYGIKETRKGLLPWKWAEGMLKKTRNYFLTTVRPDGRPHVMPIWGIWMGEAFYFSSGANSVKARNLAENANCVLCPGGADEALIVEGTAAQLSDKKVIKKFVKAYFDKYEWDMASMNEPVFVLYPKTAFGQIEETFTQTATRWTFDEN